MKKRTLPPQSLLKQPTRGELLTATVTTGGVLHISMPTSAFDTPAATSAARLFAMEAIDTYKAHLATLETLDTGSGVLIQAGLAN